MDTWANFYDDLAVVFSGGATDLRGRSIILDQDSKLRPAMGSERDDRRAPQLFFSPSADDEGTDATATKLPRALASRIVYTHPDIPWTVTEPVRRRRPGGPSSKRAGWSVSTERTSSWRCSGIY